MRCFSVNIMPAVFQMKVILFRQIVGMWEWSENSVFMPLISFYLNKWQRHLATYELNELLVLLDQTETPDFTMYLVFFGDYVYVHVKYFELNKLGWLA